MERSSSSRDERKSSMQSLIILRYINLKLRWNAILIDIRQAYKEHINTLFWVRLGIRICLGFLYLALSKCEHDILAMVYSQIEQPCIQYYEINNSAQLLLMFGSVPILPDFFLGIFGIFPIYRIYNDPFVSDVIFYNLTIACIGIVTGLNAKIQLKDCDEVSRMLHYASNMEIAIGILHIVPICASFAMLRKQDFYLLISRLIRCFRKPPYEGFWWALPKYRDYVHVHLELTEYLQDLTKPPQKDVAV